MIYEPITPPLRLFLSFLSPPNVSCPQEVGGTLSSPLVASLNSQPSRRLDDEEYLAAIGNEEAAALMGVVKATRATQQAAVQVGGDTAVQASLEAVNAALAALSVRGGGGGGGGKGSTTGGGGVSVGPVTVVPWDRFRSRLSLLLAGEHSSAGNLSAARGLLLQACHTYRRYSLGDLCGGYLWGLRAHGHVGS